MHFQKNIGGPLRELGHQIRLRAEDAVVMPRGSVGRARLAHVIAMIQRTGASNTSQRDGGLPADLVAKLEAMLTDVNAKLQPEEARFKHMTEWYDPVQIRAELRSNLMRLVDVPQEKCIELALDLHVLHDLYMRHHHGPEAGLHHLTVDDMYAHEALRFALGRCIRHVPELAMCSMLRLNYERAA